MLTDEKKGLTVTQVQAEIDALVAGFRLKKRRLNALLAVLKAEAAGQMELPGMDDTPDGKKK